jgi:hypothetical protein
MLLPLSILFGALLTVFTALGLGRLMLRAIPVGLYRGEEDALGFVAGSAALSGILFVLSVLHLVRRGVALALAGVVLIAVIRFGAWRSSRPRFVPLPRRWLVLFLAAFAVFTVLYFFSAMAPEFSPDGISYHLSFVAKYAREHGFVRIPTNMYAQLSQGIELLFLLAFLFGQHSSAALVHYAFLLALTLAIVSYGRRAGYPLAGLAGALLVYASPVVGIDGTSAYNDVAVACILFAVFYLLQIWDEQRQTGLLILIGLVAGFGYAAKYTAGLAIPYAVAYVLWRTRKLRPAVIVALCSLFLALPWVVKNILWVGNPVSPLFNRYFPNPYVHIDFERYWSGYLTRYDLPTRWSIPLEATVRGERLCGLLGPVFLLIPLAFFGVRLRAGRRALAAAVLFTIPYFANIGTRFFIPPLPFYAFALGLALTEMRLLLAVVMVAHAVLSWPTAVRWYSAPYPWMLGRIPLRQALRLESQDSWLGRKQPDYEIAKLIERIVPPNERVLSTSGLPEAYTRREIIVHFQSGWAENLGDMFAAAILGDDQPKCGERIEFPRQDVRKLRLIQTGTRVRDIDWSIHELRLYSGGNELRRDPEWRLTAHPNPWDIQQAFDNSPVTRWRSWQPFEPGMYVDIDLGRPRSVDAVQVEGPLDCAEHKLRLDAITPSAPEKWTTLAADRRIVVLSPPAFMGKAAMREWRLRGISYLFIRDGDFGAAEIVENPEAWGLTLAGQANNGRLYRLDAGYPQFEDAQQHGPVLSRR